jgi:hypothetical protein
MSTARHGHGRCCRICSGGRSAGGGLSRPRTRLPPPTSRRSTTSDTIANPGSPNSKATEPKLAISTRDGGTRHLGDRYRPTRVTSHTPTHTHSTTQSHGLLPDRSGPDSENGPRALSRARCDRAARPPRMESRALRSVTHALRVWSRARCRWQHAAAGRAAGARACWRVRSGTAPARAHPAAVPLAVCAGARAPSGVARAAIEPRAHRGWCREHCDRSRAPRPGSRALRSGRAPSEDGVASTAIGRARAPCPESRALQVAARRGGTGSRRARVLTRPFRNRACTSAPGCGPAGGVRRPSARPVPGVACCLTRPRARPQAGVARVRSDRG